MRIQRIAGVVVVVATAVIAGVSGAGLIAGNPNATGPPELSASADITPGASSGLPSASASLPVESQPPPSASPSQPLPGDIADEAWIAFDGEAYVAGTLGAGPTLVLPLDEIGLDAQGGRAVSVDAATRSSLTVRDLVNGAVIVSISTSLTIDNAALAGDELYLSARTADGSSDAGIWQSDVTGTEPVLVVPAVAGGPTIGETRAWIKLSPTARTVGSTVCTTETPCTTQIWRRDLGTVITIDDFYIRWVSDAVAVVSQGPVLRAYALSDLSLLWTIGDDASAHEFQDGYFLSDGQSLVLHWLAGVDGDRRYETVVVDSTTGDITVVAAFEADEASRRFLASAVSSDTHSVLLSESTVESAVRDGATLRVLHLATGTIDEYPSPFGGTSQ